MLREEAPDVLRDGRRAAVRRQAEDASGRRAMSENGAADVDREPPVTLRFGPRRRREMSLALGVCRDHGWPLSSSEGPLATSIVVPGQHVVRLLHRLRELGAGPDKVVIRSADAPRLPVRALHEALPPGTTLKISG